MNSIKSNLDLSSGCLECYNKPKLSSSLHEPLKDQKHQYQVIHKAKILKDFWMASTCGVDKSVCQLQVTGSSVSNSTPRHDAHVNANLNNPADFVNHGLHLWNQNRQQWIGHKKPVNQLQQLHEPKLNWNATHDSLFGSNKPLPNPIPLPEMVDFLMDFWELEGLYD